MAGGCLPINDHQWYSSTSSSYAYQVVHHHIQKNVPLSFNSPHSLHRLDPSNSPITEVVEPQITKMLLFPAYCPPNPPLRRSYSRGTLTPITPLSIPLHPHFSHLSTTWQVSWMLAFSSIIWWSEPGSVWVGGSGSGLIGTK